jgi:hypothetical protein
MDVHAADRPGGDRRGERRLLEAPVPRRTRRRQDDLVFTIAWRCLRCDTHWMAGPAERHRSACWNCERDDRSTRSCDPLPTPPVPSSPDHLAAHLLAPGPPRVERRP